MPIKYAAIFMISMLLFLPGAKADSKHVLMVSVEWPPYSGEHLPHQGVTIHAAKQTFAAMGYTLEVDFLPWKRVLHTVRTDPKYIGYLPEYYDYFLAKEFIYSEAMGSSPLVFIEHADFPVTWQTLGDLHRFTIGVVGGYVNTQKFDALVESDVLKTEPVVDDRTNIRKIAAKRIPLAVIDQHVFNHLMANDPSLAQLQGVVRVNPRPLGDKDLFVCFSNTRKGSSLANIFNSGLQHVDFKALRDAYSPTPPHAP